MKKKIKGFMMASLTMVIYMALFVVTGALFILSMEIESMLLFVFAIFGMPLIIGGSMLMIFESSIADKVFDWIEKD